MNKPGTKREQHTSLDLYHACASGDTAVQAEAYQTLWQYLYRVAYNMTYKQPDGPALAQDSAQKALIRVHEQFDQCQEPKAFKGWARRIVSNLVIDELRRRKRFVQTDEDKSLADEPDKTAVSLEGKRA